MTPRSVSRPGNCGPALLYWGKTSFMGCLARGTRPLLILSAKKQDQNGQ
jgi:hypothetical protein